MPDEIKLLSGLLVAALTGLTFIAYKHPYNYRKLDKVLWAILVLIQTAIIVWNASILHTEITLLQMPLDDMPSIHKAIGIVRAQVLPFYYLVLISLAELYLFFIWSFPYWLLEEKKPE
jgi:hypothetical protein